MNEPLPVPSGPAARDDDLPAGPRTAGAMLKAARERQGLHLAVLAATIKVAPAKLEALESDRYDGLPNATFARALAQSVCRSLKIDPRPVLALLPPAEALPLEGSAGRLNTPFQERPGRSDSGGLAWTSKPLFWAGGLLLVAAVLVGLLPAEWVERWRSPAEAALPAIAIPAAPLPSPSPAASAAAGGSAREFPVAASAAAPQPPAATALAASAPAEPAQVSPPAVAAPGPAVAIAASAAQPAALGSVTRTEPPLRGLRVAARDASWIEVVDAQGQSPLSRIVQSGEIVDIEAPLPLRVRVGNAGGTTLTFRGQVFDLGPYTRNNVARVELR